MVEPLLSERRPLRCPVALHDPAHGRVTGCWTGWGDTVAYFYRDAAGTVTSAGEVVSGSAEASKRRFEEELRTITAEVGEPSLVCDRVEGGWEIRDRRWVTGGTHRALILSVPLVDFGATPSVHSVAQVGPVDCRLHYSVPFGR